MGENNTEHITDKMTAILDIRRNDVLPSGDIESIYSYVGPLRQEGIHKMTEDIEGRLLSTGMPKGKVKKTFNILIEGLQNAFIHGLANERDKHLGLSVLYDGEDTHITILSVTDSESYEKVSGLVSDLNAMDRAEIKAHYLNVMSNGEISEKGGAGLGLITMVMKSSSGMTLEALPLKGGRLVLSSKMTV